MSPFVPSPPAAVASGRPPVEHRVLGMDRRTFRLPLVAVAIILLWTVVMPAINRSVSFDDPVRAGDAIWIGQGVSMAPPVGWGIERGVRTDAGVRSQVFASEATEVAGAGITVTTQAGRFAGDAAALLRQSNANNRIADSSGTFVVKGPPATVTIDGRRGVGQQFRGPAGAGATFAFAHDGRGILLTMAGPEVALERNATKLGEMVASIDFHARSTER